MITTSLALAITVCLGLPLVVWVAFLLQRAANKQKELALALGELSSLRGNWEAMQERLSVAERLGAAAQARAEHLAPLEQRFADAQARVLKLSAEIAAHESRAEADATAQAQRISDLTNLRGEMAKDFKNLATSALGESRQSFMHLANEVFEKHRVQAGSEIEERRKAVEGLIAPIGESLRATHEKLEQIEKERATSFGQIGEQMANVGREAVRLTQALRASPGTRGRWGEQSLRNALELAELSVHCDFDMQKTFARMESSIRPDCLIKLPGGRVIVIDVKAPLSAYLDAVEAEDETVKSASMKRHAETLRGHMLGLAKKEYSTTVSSHLAAPPDFVAMYVPGENFYAAALEQNSGLFTEAIEKGVLIVTPTTLIALAKAIALGWRQESIAENAREVAALGRELYSRVTTLAGHVTLMGKSLDKSVQAYNSFIGSLERTVLPQARKFRDLKVTDQSQSIQVLEPLTIESRALVTGRDFVTELDLPAGQA